MTEYGIFNDESADYSELEAVEAGFYSVEDALKAIATDYADEEEGSLTVHKIEEPEEDEDEEEEEDFDEDDE